MTCIYVYANIRIMSDAEHLARVLKALGEPTRLRIMFLLSRGPLCVCEIMGILGITQTKASRHLSYLKNAGLLSSKREDRWIVYFIREDLDKEVRGVVDAALRAFEVLEEASKLEEKREEIVSNADYRKTHWREVKDA